MLWPDLIAASILAASSARTSAPSVAADPFSEWASRSAPPLKKSLFSKECSFKPASQLKNRKDRALCTFGAFQWNDPNRSFNMRSPSQAY
jgi:hypothetical protein